MGIKRAEINGECVLHVDGEYELITFDDILKRIATEELKSAEDRAQQGFTDWNNILVDIFDTKQRTQDSSYCRLAKHMKVSDALLKFH